MKRERGWENISLSVKVKNTFKNLNERWKDNYVSSK